MPTRDTDRQPKAGPMVLGALVAANGTHRASWLLDGAQDDASVSIAYFTALAQEAERGLLDLFFIADTPAARTEDLAGWSHAPMYMDVLEPVTLLSALAPMTRHIGLGATASTSFYEPYNVARLFASLDHISHGRAAWNVVTSANNYAARNFGEDRLAPHARRYERAQEFCRVVRALWDTWDDDAFINDRAARQIFDPAKFHVLDHQGEFFRVHGGLNLRRPPQGQPVIIQAGASEKGKDLAAETADIVYGAGTDKEKAAAFYRDLKGRMAKFGRQPDALKILSGLTIVLGRSEAEARARWAEWAELIHPEAALLYLKEDIELDLRDLPLDAPVPEDRIPTRTNFTQIYVTEVAAMMREGLTLREVCRRYSRSRTTVFGTPSQVVDLMTDWVADGAADGFLLSFPTLPGSMTAFIDQVVPLLQERGAFKTAYRPGTLRDKLGLPRPASRYAAPA